MSNEVLPVVEQRQVEFYGDAVIAVAVETAGRRTVYVPLRPICELMEVDWSAQYRRIKRDPVLSRYAASVAITATDGRGEGTREMVSRPSSPYWAILADT